MPKKWDIVLNGYAAQGVNDLHIIVGSTIRKTSRFSTTSYWKTRAFFQGKLQEDYSLFNKKDNKLVTVGSFNPEKLIQEELRKIRTIYPNGLETNPKQ